MRERDWSATDLESAAERIERETRAVLRTNLSASASVAVAAALSGTAIETPPDAIRSVTISSLDKHLDDAARITARTPAAFESAALCNAGEAFLRDEETRSAKLAAQITGTSSLDDSIRALTSGAAASIWATTLGGRETAAEALARINAETAGVAGIAGANTFAEISKKYEDDIARVQGLLSDSRTTSVGAQIAVDEAESMRKLTQSPWHVSTTDGVEEGKQANEGEAPRRNLWRDFSSLEDKGIRSMPPRAFFEPRPLPADPEMLKILQQQRELMSKLVEAAVASDAASKRSLEFAEEGVRLSKRNMTLTKWSVGFAAAAVIVGILALLPWSK